MNLTPYVQFVDVEGKIIETIEDMPEVPPEGTILNVQGEDTEVLAVNRYLNTSGGSGVIQWNYAVEVQVDYSLDHTDQV